MTNATIALTELAEKGADGRTWGEVSSASIGARRRRPQFGTVIAFCSRMDDGNLSATV
mgnify:FL=1